MLRRARAALATPLLRRLLRRPSHLVAREELARRYLSGDGIEVGALNAPLRLPTSAHARYVERRPCDQLRASYSEIGSIQPPDIVSDLESMIGIGDCSVDFVIANHVLEHVENPLRALASIGRVLRPGGIGFIALPDKRFTFDKRRAVTPLAHILKDFDDGPGWSRHAHYRDWVQYVERQPAGKINARAKALEAERADIHFHVWDLRAMREMFDYASSSLAVEHARENRGEVIWLLRRR